MTSIPWNWGAYSKSALHGRYGYFLELYKVVYPSIYSVFEKVVISSFFFSHRRCIKGC